MGLFSSLSANNILSFLLLFGGTPPKIPLSLYHSECLFLVSRKRLLWWRFSARTGAANRHGVGCLHHFPLCFKRRGKFFFLISVFHLFSIEYWYRGFFDSFGAGRREHIMPHSLCFSSLSFIYFLGFILFSKEYPGGTTTFGPLTLWSIALFSSLLSKSGMARRVDRGTRPLSSFIGNSSICVRRGKEMTRIWIGLNFGVGL